MPDNTQTLIDLIIRISAFGLIFCLWLAGLLVWYSRRKSREQRLGQRLGLREPEDAEKKKLLRLWKDGQEATTSVSAGWHRSWLYRLEQLCHNAGWSIAAQALLLGLGGLCLTVFLAVLVITGSPVMGGCAAAVPPFLGWAFVQSRVKRRLALFESQFVEALELAARSLRAGHPLAGAFRLVSDEMADPVGSIFGEICQLQAMGVSLESAMRNVARGSASSDLRLFATSVAIQLRTGGNLADMMYRLAHVIRDRMRLKRRVGVLTAQTQMSKRILLALPFILFVVLNLLNPKYMVPMYASSTGHLLLAIAGAAMVLGVIVMNRLSDLKY